MALLNQKSGTMAWLILLILALIWGTSFILIKKGLEVFSFNEVGALRIVITFLFLLPLVFSRLKKVNRRTWIYLLMAGILGSAIPPFLFAKAQEVIDSHLSGILNSLTPLFTLIIGSLFFRMQGKWYNILGVLVGLAGAAGLLLAHKEHSFVFNFTYASFILIATVCYAINVNLVKTLLKDVDAVTITVLTFFMLGFPFLIYLLVFTDFPRQLFTDSHAVKGLGYMILLSVFGTGLALIAFNKLIKMASPLFAASVTYMIPVVAILWGIIDGEVFKPGYILWILIILGGVFLVNRKPKRMHRPPFPGSP